jgi:hypothetical protein
MHWSVVLTTPYQTGNDIVLRRTGHVFASVFDRTDEIATQNRTVPECIRIKGLYYSILESNVRSAVVSLDPPSVGFCPACDILTSISWSAGRGTGMDSRTNRGVSPFPGRWTCASARSAILVDLGAWSGATNSRLHCANNVSIMYELIDVSKIPIYRSRCTSPVHRMRSL